MAYKVVEAKGDAAALQEAVNELIHEGWQPLGGIAVAYSPNSGSWWYYQAMVNNPQVVLPGDDDERASVNIASGWPKPSIRG